MDVETASEAVEMEHHEMRPFAGVEAQGNFPHGSSFMSSVSSTSCTISYTRSTRIYLYAFLFLTCLPLTAGGAFTVIFIEDRNTHGAVSAFLTAAISCGTLSLFFMHLFGKIEKYHDSSTLSGLKILGMIVSVVEGLLLGVYAIVAFLEKQEFQLKGANYFSAAVFTGLCLGTSLEMYLVAQWYQNALKKNAALALRAAAAAAQPGPSRF